MLSIIIPTFNEEKYLPLLLESISKQTYQDYEIFVADHNSTDKTAEIANSYGAKVLPGGLPSIGRNIGALNAVGQIYLFLDADVVLSSPKFLINCLQEFERRQLDVATCYVEAISPRKTDFVLHAMYNGIMKLTAGIKPHAPGFCIFVKNHLHHQINGFDPKIKLAEDSVYVQELSKIATFGILKSHKIAVSIRRLERDGRFNIFSKYLLCGFHMLFFGRVKSNIFNYTFGHR